MAAVALGAALIPLNSTMVAVALPDMGQRLNAGAGSLTLWLVTSYLCVNVVLQSPAGKLGDLVGRRRAFAIGQALFAAGTLLAVTVPVLPAIGASRMLMAAGGAMVVPTAMALMRTSIPAARRARAFGYFGSLMGASAAIGPVLGGALTHQLGWKSIFYVNWPLLLLSGCLLASETSPRGARPGPPSAPGFDLVGTALLAVGLTAVVVGLKSSGGSAAQLLALGAISLLGLVAWERRAPTPLVPPVLARRVPFIAGGAVVALHNLGMYALLFQLPFFLKELFGLEADAVGPILLAMTLAMVLASPIGGRSVEHLGTRATVSIGAILGLAGLGGLLLASQRGSLPLIVAGLGLVGSGVGVVTGPAQAAALSSIPADQSGVGAGLLTTMRYLGGIAGISIVSVVLADHAPERVLARNQSCLELYLGATVLALLVAQLLPPRGALGSQH